MGRRPHNVAPIQQEMKWWVSSLDLQSTKKYNLAARWLLRQSGIVRQRGEEFDPNDLTFKEAVFANDPETQEQIEVEAEDCLFGLNKLLTALEDINGMTALDRKGELRSQFYLGTHRKAGERVSEYCTRFRTIVAELKSEQVNLPSSELGWFLRDKLGLDPLRRQLLDTALAGAEDYLVIEREILRLFKDLHVSDPLFRRSDPGDAQRPKLSIRRMFGQHGGSGMSSSSSTISRSPSTFSSRSSLRSTPSSGTRRVYLTEVPEGGAEDGEEPELIPAGDDQEPEAELDDTANPVGLEDILQTEAECFAAELQDAEAHGVQSDVLAGMEQRFEQAAEALVTMKEARSQLQAIRKDRGYGKPADAKTGSGKGAAGGQISSRKSSGKFPCFDCNQHGHWAGDKECTMPGAGLGRKGGAVGRPKAKQVRLAEALEIETAAPSVGHGTSDDVNIAGKSHEAAVVHRLSTPLHEALEQSNQRADLSLRSAQVLSNDKLQVGALDSACNRTCCGECWMDSYLNDLRSSAPFMFSSLVCSVDEQERFRFGNGGTVTSSKRWRIPTCISGTVVLIWVSVVPVLSLGCLLGRDFLDSVGAVLNFANRTLECSFINSTVQRLDQLAAGHFMLPLLPRRWPRLGSGAWRKCGLDNIIELQLDPSDWLKRRIAEGMKGHPMPEYCSHEQHVTESCMSATGLHHVESTECSDVGESAQEMASQHSERVFRGLRPRGERHGGQCAISGGSDAAFGPDDGEQGRRKVRDSDLGAHCATDFDEGVQTGLRSISLEAIHPPRGWTKAVVRAKLGLVVGIALLSAVLTIPISISQYGGDVEAPGPVYGGACSPSSSPSHEGTSSWCLYCCEPPGTSTFPRSDWLASGFPGRLVVDRLPPHEIDAWAEAAAESRCHRRGQAEGPDGGTDRGERAIGQGPHWTQRRPTLLERGPYSTGAFGACGRAPHRYGGNPSRKSSSNGGRDHGQEQACIKGCRTTSESCDQVEGQGSTPIRESRSSSELRVGRVHDICMVNGGSSRVAEHGDSPPDHDGRSRGTLSSNVEPSDAACDGYGPESNDLAGQCGSTGRDDVTPDGQDDFHLQKGKMKSGVKQMISQAWSKHRRQQLAVSLDKNKLWEIFMADWDNEMKGFMNEAFTMELHLTPFVTEVYTDTEPIAKAAQKKGLLSGDSLTLGTGWDFSDARHRDAAFRLIRRTKPYALVIAFPCGVWSMLQNLNPPADLEDRRAEAKVLVLFALALAELQLASGRHFLIENPVSSAAWRLEEVMEFRDRPDVLEVVVDMCCFGLKGPDGKLHKKGTRLLTSSQALVSLLQGYRCDGGHVHSWVLGGSKITTAAGHYTTVFSDAVVEGFMDQADFERRVQESQTNEVNVSEVFAAERAGTAVDGDDVEMESLASDDELGKPNKDVAIPQAVRQAVYQLHVNTGHRSRLRLARALLISGAPASAIEAAKQLKCSICAERRGPKPRPPASLPPPRNVGEQAHIDLVVLEDSLRRPYFVAHCTDQVSRYQAAAVLSDKSTAAVIEFLQVHWFPLLGRPATLVADQGREFVSAAFGDWCDSKSIYLYHIGVGAPWQNGVAERSGGTLKALTGAICATHAVSNMAEMRQAVGEAVAAYNADPNESGVSPLQLVTGRNPQLSGDVLNNFSGRLAEHSLIEADPSLAKQVAMREVARIAMVRLHYSKGLRQAELARSRRTTAEDAPEPGDLVFFWRAQKYQSRKDVSGKAARRLQLRRWHGPALLVAREGVDGTEFSANCFVSFRGQLTKCPMEHVRKASSLESIAAGSWEAAIDEVLRAAQRDADADVSAHPRDDDEQAELQAGPSQVDAGDVQGAITPQAVPVPMTPVLNPAELFAALRPEGSGPLLSTSRPMSLRMQDVESHGGPAASVAMGAPESEPPRSSFPSSPAMQESVSRARSLDERGVKRPAAEQLVPQQGDKSGVESKPAFQALTMTWEQLCNVTENVDVHPMFRLQAEAEMDRRSPLDNLEYDHGSWDGRWAFVCERDWKTIQALGMTLPVGEIPFEMKEDAHEAFAVQASRKEYVWSQLNPEKKELWREAAVKGWNAYVENSAVKILSLEESKQVRKDLARRGELDLILQPRFVLTDKHDGLRTPSHPLPIKASSRLVVPGFKDKSNLDGLLRRDAPTGSRLAQHILFSLAAFFTHWSIISADIKAAFLKGDPYVSRELYLMAVDEKKNPPIPLLPGQLCRVVKGIFGLADAPREWWLRLSRTMDEHGWQRSILDQAMWLLWGKDAVGADVIEAIVVAHVDDLLFAGSPIGRKSLDSIGKELGFGSLEVNDFVWCGKRIRRASDGTIRLSMKEYHQNLQEMYLPKHRKSELQDKLDVHEAKRLRALLGSLQWLVAQIRFDMSYGVSSLQGESPATVSTVLRANSLTREFKATGDFEMIFKAVDYRSGGVVMVSDAALGNVRRDGSDTGEPITKVFSQGCYFALLGDLDLVEGRQGHFNILDARSHRIPRVCRSTYAAETLACEEAFDVGQLCRGFIATVRGHELLGRGAADRAVSSVKMTVAVDAKDVHDKGNSDTASFGSQKSLAFTVAWLRAVLRKPNTALKWTATENMWVDGGTKLMDLSHMRAVMKNGTWSISYSPEFVKQVLKARSKKTPQAVEPAGADLPGEDVHGDDPMLLHLNGLCDRRGWHYVSGIGVQVACAAKSFRTPEPRFSIAEYPLRTTYGRFEISQTERIWRVLEKSARMSELANQHALFGRSVPVLISCFHKGPLPSIEQENERDVKA